MAEGQILYASCDGVHCLRLLGEVRYPLAPTLERCLNNLLDDSTVAFAVDLTEVSTIDSTNLGLLARLANRLRQQGKPPLTLVSDQDDITELLIALGFDEVCHILPSEDGSSPNTAPLPLESYDRDDMVHTVLEAHRALVKLKESNRERFKDVIALLEAGNGEDVVPRNRHGGE